MRDVSDFNHQCIIFIYYFTYTDIQVLLRVKVLKLRPIYKYNMGNEVLLFMMTYFNTFHIEQYSYTQSCLSTS